MHRKANVNVRGQRTQTQAHVAALPESDVAVGCQQDQRGVSRQSIGRAAGRQRSRAGATGDNTADADPKNHSEAGSQAGQRSLVAIGRTQVA